ncbi:MAG: carbonic anhydrase [Phycisphaeraceae bacterium]
MPYTSDIPFEPRRIHAAAVYCSDGRFGDQCDQFLHEHLKLPNYDRVALPGGPGALAGHDRVAVDADAVMTDLRFLVDAHELERVVLISHSGCAFYALRLGLTEPELAEQQVADLARVAARLRDLPRIAQVDTYLAQSVDDRIHFEPVRTR